MNVYMTAGTYDFLKTIQDKYPNEQMTLMQNTEGAQLMHETAGKSVFQMPRKYEVIESVGEIPETGYVAASHVPVRDEGKPVFEFACKNRDRIVDQQQGFKAYRVLRPLSGDTYVIVSIWEDGEAYNRWQRSDLFQEAGGQPEVKVGENKSVLAGPSYVSTFIISRGEETAI